MTLAKNDTHLLGLCADEVSHFTMTVLIFVERRLTLLDDNYHLPSNIPWPHKVSHQCGPGTPINGLPITGWVFVYKFAHVHIIPILSHCRAVLLFYCIVRVTVLISQIASIPTFGVLFSVFNQSCHSQAIISHLSYTCLWWLTGKTIYM